MNHIIIINKHYFHFGGYCMYIDVFMFTECIRIDGVEECLIGRVLPDEMREMSQIILMNSK